MITFKYRSTIIVPQKEVVDLRSPRIEFRISNQTLSILEEIAQIFYMDVNSMARAIVEERLGTIEAGKYKFLHRIMLEALVQPFPQEDNDILYDTLLGIAEEEKIPIEEVERNFRRFKSLNRELSENIEKIRSKYRKGRPLKKKKEEVKSLKEKQGLKKHKKVSEEGQLIIEMKMPPPGPLKEKKKRKKEKPLKSHLTLQAKIP